MEKKNKAEIVAAIVLGILCVGIIVVNIVLYSSGSVDKLNPTSAKKNDFKETEETAGYDDVVVKTKDFEVVIATDAPAEGENPDVEGQEENVDYICSESAEKELTEEDVTVLQGKTIEGLPEGKDVVQMVINEIYARKGYQFTDEAIQDYFNSRTWYQEIEEKTADMDAILESMTDIEKANVDFLNTYVQ